MGADDHHAEVPRGAAALLIVAGLALSGSTLLPWTVSQGVASSLWKSASAVDVSVGSLGCLAAALALVARARGGYRAFLVAVVCAAALSSICVAGEYVKELGTGFLAYPGPVIALGCASMLLAGAAICVRRPGRVRRGPSRPVALGRAALLAAGVTSPTLTLATGVGGVSFYERFAVVDIGLVVLAVLVLSSAVLVSRQPLMAWIAIAAGAGLAAVSYTIGLELLLAEQDAFDDADGTGVLLAFVAAPLAAAGTVLLAAATDEAAHRDS